FSEPGATLGLVSKDIRHIRRLADQAGAPLPLADLVHRHFLTALAQGRNELDLAALSTVLREAAGLPSG
ncbi:MAG: NAD-binding protein, partial [Dehalococcoidia bacterium]